MTEGGTITREQLQSRSGLELLEAMVAGALCGPYFLYFGHFSEKKTRLDPRKF